MRLVPKPGTLEVGRPVRMADIGHGADERFPVMTGARRSRHVGQCGDRFGRLGDMIEHALRRGGTDAGNQMHQAEARDAVARILDKTQ